MIVKALSLSLSRFLAGFWINKLQGSKGPKLKHLPVKALSLSLSRFCLKVKPFHFHFHKTPKGESRRRENSATLKMGKNNAVYHGTNSQGSSYTNYDSGETVPADG